jgi:hypothetical protein
MWTRGRDKDQAGKFAYELYSADNVLIERVGGFATHTEADRAAEVAQRRVLFPVADAPLTLDEILMSDDELLAALEG